MLLIFCALQIGLNAQEEITIGKYQILESELLGGEVTYLVHLPKGYEDTNKDYPVLYIMDGHSISTFANAVATIENLSFRRIPEMIIIGISNTGVARKMLFCPSGPHVTDKYEEIFYDFFNKELIPEIQNKYRTNNYRILSGQSSTGLYAMYNFLFYPELFDAYIVRSPLFLGCPKFYLSNTKSFLQENKEIYKKLYISYGSMDRKEVLDHMNELEEMFKQSSESLKWKIEKIENSGHIPYVSLNNALLFIFSETTMTPEMKQWSVTEIKTHYEKISKEYGFNVNPKIPELFDLANDLKFKRRFDEAIELFEYLISIDSSSEHFFYFLGQTYQQNGNFELAKKNYNEALKINPNFDMAKFGLRKIEELNPDM